MENNENREVKVETLDRDVARTTLFGVAVLSIVGVVALAICLALAPDAHSATGPGRPVHHIQPACPSDEGDQPGPCVWVGSVDGNGEGRSFRIRVNRHDPAADGRLKYISDMRARQLRGLPYGYSPYGTSARQAPDQRACVSKREFRSAPIPVGRRALEVRWDVIGKGLAGHDPSVTTDRRSLVYPSCGFNRDESFVVVWFNQHGRAVMALRWVADGATSHGVQREVRS